MAQAPTNKKAVKAKVTGTAVAEAKPQPPKRTSMVLKRVQIKNFRGLRTLDVELDETTVLIGENNSGKTSFLEAVRLALSRSHARRGGTFETYDYHLAGADADPQTANPIEIQLTIEQVAGGEIAEDITQALGDVIIEDREGTKQIRLKVSSAFDPALADFATVVDFLNSNDEPLQAKFRRLLDPLSRFFPVFYLSAFRDASREFKSGAFWTPFLKNPQLPEETRTALQTQIGELNANILKEHTALKSVKDYVAKVQQLVAIGQKDIVDIEALPGRIMDLLAGTQVTVKGTTGAAIPLTRHGAGTQSLSVLFLFEAFLRSMLEQQYEELSVPLLTLEEPEAHLHPCAARALWTVLSSISGQKLIASHSGDLLARVPLTAVRRFISEKGQIAVRRVKPGLLDQDEQRKFEFHLQATRGELLFARCWLLGEGESEYWLLAGLASLLDLDLDLHGIRFLAYSVSGIDPLIKVANELGIHWFVVADGDPQGNANVKKAEARLNGQPKQDHIVQFAQPNIEVFLCENGFSAIFEHHVSPQKKASITAGAGTREYWTQVVKAGDDTPKPAVIQEIVAEIKNRGVPTIPATAKDILEKTVKLSKVP
jgi:putative ATP-dependent endonuclease of the OLD family